MKQQYATILDGKKLAEDVKRAVREEVRALPGEPGLAAVLIGNDPASELYVKLKKQSCEAAGIHFSVYRFDADHETKDIIEAISFLNKDEEINGILVQLPLPEKYNTDEIIGSIDPAKDVDGFHPATLKSISEGKPTILSPLVLGIDGLIMATKEPVENKVITLLCNHEVFAEPFKFLYGKNNKVFPTTLDDPLWQEKCHNADILIVAIGKPQFITNEVVKQDATVIDVGINKLKDDTVGDIDFNNVILKSKFITPVPGGVGPMTVAYLMKNLVTLYKQQHS